MYVVSTEFYFSVKSFDPSSLFVAWRGVILLYTWVCIFLDCNWQLKLFIMNVAIEFYGTMYHHLLRH